MNKMEIPLPPYGFLMRDLMVSGLYALSVNSFGDLELTGDYAAIKYPSEYALINGAEALVRRLNSDSDVNINGFLERFRRNYSSQLDSLRKMNNSTAIVNELKSFVNICRSYINIITECNNENISVIEHFSLILPESMESIRWYGGWNGSTSRKSKKFKVNIPLIVAYFALAGLSYFTLSLSRSKNTSTLLVAPIDSVVKAPSLLWAKSMKIPWFINVNQGRIRIADLPHLTRLFIVSLLLNGDRYHKVIVLSVSNRVEIIEDNPQSSLSSLMSFASNLNSHVSSRLLSLMSERFINELRNEIGGYRKEAIEEAVNDVKYVLTQISDNVYKALSGVLSPEEAIYMIARETYMRYSTYGRVINDYLLKELRVSMRATLLG